MQEEEYNAALEKAIDLFNQREFFACHDVLEEVWTETVGAERDFLQGLIHAAVALFHFGEGNLGGARKMHDSALKYLSSYGDEHSGIDFVRFRRDFDLCFHSLLGAWWTYPSEIRMDETLIPQLYRMREKQ